MTFNKDIERFFSHVQMPSNGLACWLWVGRIDHGGYGHLKFLGEHVKAHRMGFQLGIRMLDRSEHLDHLCNIRSCVNPQHLEVVSAEENTYRRWMRDPHRPKNYRPKIHSKYSKDIQHGL